MIKLFNTLHHKLEEFVPIEKGKAGIYSCGPTVYWNAHIGHMYAFVVWDVFVRFLKWEGYDVTRVMNITDVGHLTSDSDTGEDKMEKGAERENLTVWQVAKKYTEQFFSSTDELNVLRPDVVCLATDHIREMIELVQKIEQNGYAYKIADGVYFDTSKLKNYGEMAKLNLEGQEEGARIEKVLGKKNPQDFALWKFSYPEGRDFIEKKDDSQKRRQMEWQSPWGLGFPGWHIECTAMSVKYLGENFDIHTGGIEHIPIHHTNELAQAEGAYHHNTANFWLHNNHLNLKGEKMSKSSGNVYTVSDLKEKGFDPLSLRYLFLNSHYRQGVQFSLDALTSSQNALNNLRSMVSGLTLHKYETNSLSKEKDLKRENFLEKFRSSMEDDLNYPNALAAMWDSLKSNIPSLDKLDLLYEFDDVFGLKLREYASAEIIKTANTKIPKEITDLSVKRDALRNEKKFSEADSLRKIIEEKGWRVVDEGNKGKVIKRS